MRKNVISRFPCFYVQRQTIDACVVIFRFSIEKMLNKKAFPICGFRTTPLGDNQIICRPLVSIWCWRFVRFAKSFVSPFTNRASTSGAWQQILDHQSLIPLQWRLIPPHLNMAETSGKCIVVQSEGMSFRVSVLTKSTQEQDTSIVELMKRNLRRQKQSLVCVKSMYVFVGNEEKLSSEWPIALFDEHRLLNFATNFQ